MSAAWIAVVAAAGLAGVAAAEPLPRAGSGVGELVRTRHILPGIPGSGPADGPAFSDGFDSYSAGSGIAGQGGWELWYTGGGDGVVDSSLSASAPNSLRITTNSDVVHRFTVDDGVWVFRIKVFVPSNTPAGIGGYVNVMNQYGAPGVDNASLQIGFNDTQFGTTTTPFLVESQWDNATLPLVLGQWIEFRSEIDLVNDQVTNFYNNAQLGLPHLWTDNNFVTGPGITSIACVDLYSPAIAAMYFDDIALQPLVACYPDCNEDNALTVQDFGCFQTKFVAGDPYADCNGDGVRTVQDFGCFQTRFVAGCP